MKLITKYSRSNVIASVVILLLASLAYFFVLKFILLQQIDDDLNIEKKEFYDYVSVYKKLPDITTSEDEVTTYALTTKEETGKVFTKRITRTGETEPYRVIRFYQTINSQTYRIEVSKSLENTDKIIRMVILITIITIILLLLTTLVINRIALRRLWKPFYKTLQAMKEYRLGNYNDIRFLPTDIDEFKNLNDTLQESISRNEQDYNALKAFTENASHEMQTPVAVIRSQMDSLIQDAGLTETQSNIVQEAYAALQKLSRLNKSLLLLTKIENRQFDNKEFINLKVLVGEKLVGYSEILQQKNISVKMNSTDEVIVKMNSGLADVLVNNLLINCIKYTSTGGKIEINFQKNMIEFCNGPALGPLQKNLIFTRFYKEGSQPDQHGLGLAIVKEICLSSGLDINYSFREEQHVFKISILS